MSVPRGDSQPLSTRLLGIVLCGGRSSRMGQDKATLAHPSGMTYLAHAIERLRPLCADVATSGPATDRFGSSNATHSIPDPRSHHGPVTGIAASLAFAQAHYFGACLITPVDMPYLTTEHLQSLCDAYQVSYQLTLATTTTHSEVTNSEQSMIEPLVGIYPIELAMELQQLAESADRSLSRWILKRAHQTVPLPPQACLNINTPEDFKHA